jgi:hypothetical protein
MMLQCFLGTVAVVVSQLDTRREIIFRYQHEMWTIADHHGLRHKIAVARVVHEAAEFAGFGCGVNATGGKIVRVVQ